MKVLKEIQERRDNLPDSYPVYYPRILTSENSPAEIPPQPGYRDEARLILWNDLRLGFKTRCEAISPGVARREPTVVVGTRRRRSESPCYQEEKESAREMF